MELIDFEEFVSKASDDELDSELGGEIIIFDGPDLAPVDLDAIGRRLKSVGLNMWLLAAWKEGPQERGYIVVKGEDAGCPM